jgi:2-iminobutanoate/2-iminopropanoate deaminase
MGAIREETQMPHTYVTSGEGVPPSVAPFSAAVVAGDICFISGQPAIDPASGQFRPGTVEEEFAVAFSNVLAIAKAAGFAATDLTYVHVALADIGDYGAVNAVYRDVLGNPDDLPARLAYAVSALPFGAKVEVQAIAVRPDTSPE